MAAEVETMFYTRQTPWHGLGTRVMEAPTSKEDIFDVGQIKMSYHNTEICTYNLERMLIELVRFRGKLSFDYYKEINRAYRNSIGNMDIAKVEEYANEFKHSDKMMWIIELELWRTSADYA